MREIKFRAWHEGRQTMFKDVAVLVCPDDLFRVYDSYSQEEYIGNDKHLVIMQYTGLKDKNGVEIYEGDIVAPCYVTPVGQLTSKRDEDTIGKITFEGGAFSLRKNYMGYEPVPLHKYCKKTEGEYKSNFGVMHELTDTTILEVIGNIYQNPDLIEGEL